MCGLVTTVWVVLCIGGPAYLMWQLGHQLGAVMFVVVALALVWCTVQLMKPTSK